MNTVAQIGEQIGVDLEGFVPQLVEPEKFIACCERFIDQNPSIEPLAFLTFLRKNEFPSVARVICQYLIQTNPKTLTRTLA
jgi:hypothetical protein